MDRIAIFDTTLRDGEQAPGFSMNVEEKLKMARQLERLQSWHFLGKELRLNLPRNFQFRFQLFLLFDVGYQLLDTLSHSVKRRGQLAELVICTDRYAVREISGFDFLCSRIEIVDSTG